MTTAYVIKFSQRVGQKTLEGVLTTKNAFLPHVRFNIEKLWVDDAPMADVEEVTHDTDE